MENNMNYTYGAPQTPLNNGGGYYVPPVQKKKGFPGILLLIIAAIAGSIPEGLGTTVVSMLVPVFNEVENISVISTTLHTVIDAVGYIFLAAAVGGAGYLWSKSFRGALKFLACFKIASLMSTAVTGVIYGIVWVAVGPNMTATTGLVMSFISYVGVALQIAFLCLSFAFFERLEKKEESKIMPVPFAYEGFASAPEKRSFNVVNVLVTVVATSAVSYVINLLMLSVIDATIPHNTTTTLQNTTMIHAIQSFSGSVNNILTLLCLVGLSFLLTKSAKSAVSICGVCALSNLLADAVTAFSRVIFILITGSFTSGTYVTFNFVLNICGIIIAAVAAVLAVSLLSKKKDFAQ